MDFLTTRDSSPDVSRGATLPIGSIKEAIQTRNCRDNKNKIKIILLTNELAGKTAGSGLLIGGNLNVCGYSYLKTGTGNAWARQVRVAIVRWSTLVTFISFPVGKRAPTLPRGSAREENKQFSSQLCFAYKNHCKYFKNKVNLEKAFPS